MYATLYRPLSEEYPTFWKAKLTDITSIISFNYKKRFYKVGEFTMEIPINEPAVPFLAVDTLLFTNDGDYLYITDIAETSRTVTIQGYDLKYLLAMRVTLFPEEEQAKGAYGYYVVKGSTEKCIKDIVDYNISDSAPEEKRKIFHFKTGLNQNRGLSSDSYMTRLESLDEVVGTLCKNANIGYDIVPNMTYSTFVFDVIVPTNRSDSQHDVSKVVFSEQFLNVTDLKRQLGVSSLKNALYTVNVRNNDTYVQLVNRNSTEASGVFRKETVVNVQCDADEIQSYALKDAEDKVKTDSFEAEVQAAESYKRDWFLGDIVTFKRGNLQIDSSVTEVEVNITGDSHRVKVTAGDNTPTVVERLSKNTKNYYLGWEEKEIKDKPYKVEGSLWFYPTNQEGTDGFKFANFGNDVSAGEFLPSQSTENSKIYALTNMTWFCNNTNYATMMRTAGFTDVRDATAINGQAWVMNGIQHTATYKMFNDSQIYPSYDGFWGIFLDVQSSPPPNPYGWEAFFPIVQGVQIYYARFEGDTVDYPKRPYIALGFTSPAIKYKDSGEIDYVSATPLGLMKGSITSLYGYNPPNENYMAMYASTAYPVIAGKSALTFKPTDPQYALFENIITAS